jgi:hypothetical protein
VSKTDKVKKAEQPEPQPHYLTGNQLVITTVTTTGGVEVTHRSRLACRAAISAPAHGLRALGTIVYFLNYYNELSRSRDFFRTERFLTNFSLALLSR